MLFYDRPRRPSLTNLVDIPLISAAHLARIFTCNAFSTPADLICSEVKKSRFQTSNIALLMAFRNILDSLPPGGIIPGGQRHNAGISCLRFAPTSAQILLPRNGL